jgi:adenylate kinase family enzyme
MRKMSCHIKFLVLSLCFMATVILEAKPSKALVIMGASCSGKSTLSNQLSELLGDQWKLVELDAIEDEFKILKKEFTEEDLVHALLSESNRHLAAGYNIIIDTNIYHKVLRDLCADDKKFILVYCPLNVLLARDAQRTINLQRNSQRAAQAREYVEETFYNFEAFDEYDVRVDSSVGNVNDLGNLLLEKLI